MYSICIVKVKPGPAERMAVAGAAFEGSRRYPPLQVVRFGGSALIEGIEAHAVEGQIVRVYCVAKTVADLFKYRNKIDLLRTSRDG